LAAKNSNLDERAIRDLFAAAVRRNGIFGAQLSIIKGAQQCDLAAGWAHAGIGLTMQTGTLMQIGSVTKLFNVTIVMSMVEEGTLELDAPVREYIPDFSVANLDATRTLSLRHLLSMSSGLDNGPYSYFGASDEALEQYVAGLRLLPQQFVPGRHFGYSNAGTCIAGYAASRVAGQSWEALVRERVLEPAGLTRAALLDGDVESENVSAGHLASPERGRAIIVDPVFSMHRSRAPSGATLAMAMKDLARFGRIFLNRGVADNGFKMLSESSVDTMLTSHIEVPTRNDAQAWCLGPYTARWDEVQIWGHSGGTPTSLSHMLLLPERDAVIAFGINSPGYFPCGRFGISPWKEFCHVMFEDVLQAAFGIRKPCIGVPDATIDPIPYRYEGVYEQLGVRMTITRVQSGIAAEYETIGNTDVSMHKTTVREVLLLRPLGKDRFLVVPAERAHEEQPQTEEVAFFGDDGNGRAMNLTNYVFAMRRRPDA
jgi:CubicO group peptidase (beta-lactamase class C family)